MMLSAVTHEEDEGDVPIPTSTLKVAVSAEASKEGGVLIISFH